MKVREFVPVVTDDDIASARAPVDAGRAHVGHMRLVEARWALKNTWVVIVAGATFLASAGALTANGVSGWLVTGLAIVGILLLAASVPTLVWGLFRAATRTASAAASSPEDAMEKYYRAALDHPLRSYSLLAPGIRSRSDANPRAYETQWRAAREVIGESIEPALTASCSLCDADTGPGMWTAETYGLKGAGDDLDVYLRCPGCGSVFCWNCAQHLHGFILSKKCGSCGHDIAKRSHLFVTDFRVDFTIAPGAAEVVDKDHEHADLIFRTPVSATYTMPWLVSQGGVTRSGPFGGRRPDYDTPGLLERGVGLFTGIMGYGGAPKPCQEPVDPSMVVGGDVGLEFHNTAVELEDGWHLVAPEPGRLTLAD